MIDLAQTNQQITVVAEPPAIVTVATPSCDMRIDAVDQRIAICTSDVQIEVAESGRPGRDGRDGSGSIAPIVFGFGDAAHPIYASSAPGTLTYCRIIVREPFNDASAAMRLGTTIDAGDVMPSAYIDLSSTNEFEHTPDVRIGVGDEVYVHIDPASSTEGAGEIFLQFIPD